MRFRKFLKPYKTRGSSFREHTSIFGGFYAKKDVSRVYSKLLYLDDIIFCLEKNRVFSIYVSGEN